MKNLSNSTQNFFKYSFNGNGKYYTTEQGSQSYRNTYFQNFYSRNADCVNIIEKGNDAPRGGQTGNYVIVEFTEKFFAKYQFWFDERELENQRKIENQKIENQNDLIIKELIVKHEEKINEWIGKYGKTSKGGRTIAWKCQKLSGFENFTVGQIYRNI